jgi:formylglycine-generating enzyme required for sulfatase activity
MRFIAAIVLSLACGATRSDAAEPPAPAEFINSIGMRFVVIPAGEFFMGSDPREIRRLSAEMPKRETLYGSENPRHRVRIRRPFHLGRTSVTIGEFRQFVTATKFQTDAERDGIGGFGMTNRKWERHVRYTWSSGAGFEATDRHPVVNVSWLDAVAFCEWLSSKEGAVYRLPTEAEWEYACRGGDARDPDPASRAQWDAMIWYRPNSEWRIHPVAERQPNAFGLYDMIGNVRNWCHDWFAADYYAISPREDPPGPVNGTNRIVRGAAFHAEADLARPATRYADPPQHRHGQLGFRVLRELEVRP